MSKKTKQKYPPGTLVEVRDVFWTTSGSKVKNYLALVLDSEFEQLWLYATVDDHIRYQIFTVPIGKCKTISRLYHGIEHEKK